MLRYTASKAAFCSSSSRASARITDSTEPGSSVSPPVASAPCSSRPASASSVSADTLSASASSRKTRTDGWCRPRSIWLRYGFERLVSSASWRSDRFASLRWLWMKLPRAFIWASHASVMVTTLLGFEFNLANNTEHNDRTAGRCRAAARLSLPAQPAATGGGGLSRQAGPPGSLGRGARLLGGGGRLAVEQRRGRVQHVLGELPLRREQLLGEVVGL